MKPSEKAIAEGVFDYRNLVMTVNNLSVDEKIRRILSTAYAIDVDPLLAEQHDREKALNDWLAEKDREIERLLECEAQSIKRGQEVIRLGQRIAELEAEIERLNKIKPFYWNEPRQKQHIVELEKRLSECEAQNSTRGTEVVKLGRRICELEAEIHGLCKFKQELADENSRLRELVEVYVPKTEVPK